MIILEIENFSRKGTLRTEVQSFQWGNKRTMPNASHGQGKFLPVDDVVVTRYLDDNSSEFFTHAVSGAPFPKVSIKLNKPDGRSGMTPYLEIILSEVYISAYSVSSGGDRPMETLSLNFKEGKFKQL